MTYDRLAERYVDKVLPQSRAADSRALERAGIDPAMYDRATEIAEAYKQTHGVMPSMEQLVVAIRREEAAKRREGI